MKSFKSFLKSQNSGFVHEMHPDFSQEHNVQNLLFGSNDYLPFAEHHIHESVEDHPTNDKRLVFNHDGAKKTSAASGIVVPAHMWNGGTAKGGGHYKGMDERNAMRASVYGEGHRPPLGLGAIAAQHKQTLDDHFAKPKHEQIAAEKAAIERLHAAGHLDSKDTTDEGEKTDTVQNEYDDKKRSFVARSSKGVAGHAVYTSGSGADQKHYVINTCPAQSKGCGGGIDAKGVADTSKGTCFAPKAESQYPGAAVRRACHAQAKHDPAMTNDWILAHTHSLRNAADAADKKNKRFLFRPNVVDETDRSSRHVIKHLNAQRATENKPPIIGNSYGKTNEMHDPANHWHVTFSNTGPKVKHGSEISENKDRDDNRVEQTITGMNQKGEHHVNDEGNQTPLKGSYMVINAKRGSELDKKFQTNVTHVKYWSKGREEHQLSQAEKAQHEAGVREGHFDGEGNPTTPDKAHYGFRTITGSDGKERRYDYQKQHVLHPRIVPVKDGKGNIHNIPTDSRFKDEEVLDKNLAAQGKSRFKTKTGKKAGPILITTPTTSTSDAQHHSSFTHDVSEAHIKHAMENNGEYEIDKPEHQEAARGKEYVAPQPTEADKKPRASSTSKMASKIAGKATKMPQNDGPKVVIPSKVPGSQDPRAKAIFTTSSKKKTDA